MNFNLCRRCIICFVLIACSIGRFASAATPPWIEASFTYVATNQKLPQVLTNFARIFGVDVRLTENVQMSEEIVNGKMTAANPSEFLNQVGIAYGLTWFYQNGILYFSKNNETSIQWIQAPGIPLASLKRALVELGFIDSKFGWGELSDRGIVLVSGPPSYVDLLSRAVSQLPAPPLDQQVQVFKLQHASVDDRTIFFRDRQIVTAGVATILRNLISGEGGKSGTNTQLVEMAAPLRASHTMGAGTTDQDAKARSDNGVNGANSTNGVNSMSSAPSSAPAAAVANLKSVIQADSRLNAVIIKDRPEYMPLYKQLIAILDVPSQLIEIEALIVDVNSSKIAELGIDWTGRTGRFRASFGLPDVAPDATTLSLARGNPSTVIADAGNFLMTRIKMMEGQGNARVISQPSILTMDNLGALIDLSETFYIQTVGERVANVVPISVGVTLKVTPRIIDDGQNKSVQLVVDIEDGAIQDIKVGSLPTVRRSTIGTQAVMGENESLLIGGFNSQHSLGQKDGVPVLGGLPVVGSFFSKTVTNVERRERLFMITPKIIPAIGQAAIKAETQAIHLRLDQRLKWDQPLRLESK